MSENEAVTALEAAQERHARSETHCEDLKKKIASATEQVEQTEKRLQEFADLPAAKLSSNDLLNAEKARRYLAQQQRLRETLAGDLTAAEDALHTASIDIARARLPLVLTELHEQARAVGTKVLQTRGDLAREFQHLRSLRDDAEQTAAAAGLPFRPDPIASAWSTITGSEGHATSVVGVEADGLFYAVASILFGVRREEERLGITDAQRAAEARARIEIGSMSDSERLASIRVTNPGYGVTVPVPSSSDTRIVAEDYDPFGGK